MTAVTLTFLMIVRLPAVSLLLSATCLTPVIAEFLLPASLVAKPVDRVGVEEQVSLTPEEELSVARKDVLESRPYRINYELVREVLILNVQPSLVVSQETPDWWSEKQGYDLARLYAIALGKYSAFKVVPPPTWDEKSLLDETRSRGVDDASEASSGLRQNAATVKRPSVLGNREIDVQLNVADYSFQHLPVKRRGVGFGFVALNAKECSTETYFKSEIVLTERSGRPGFSQADRDVGISDLVAAEDERLVLDRLIIDKTGGASLNLNFLVGGAGGGNFTPPDKPLKRVIYQSVVDGAEAAFCLLTGQKDCIAYYKARALQAPSVLTVKQKKKVGGC